MNTSYEKIYPQQGVNAINGQLGQAAGNYQDRKPTALEMLEKELDVVIEKTSHFNARISAAADRLLGSQPQETGKIEGVPTPSCTLGRLQDRVTRLRNYICYAEDQLQRIETL